MHGSTMVDKSNDKYKFESHVTTGGEQQKALNEGRTFGEHFLPIHMTGTAGGKSSNETTTTAAALKSNNMNDDDDEMDSDKLVI